MSYKRLFGGRRWVLWFMSRNGDNYRAYESFAFYRASRYGDDRWYLITPLFILLLERQVTRGSHASTPVTGS